MTNLSNNSPEQDAKFAPLSPGDQTASSAAAKANENLHAELASINALKGGSTAKPVNFDGASGKGPEPKYNDSGFVGAMVQNLEYHGIQQTAKSLVQIGDQIAGTDYASKVNLFDKPLPAAYKSAEWYGEQFGAAGGQIAPYVAAFAVTRGASAKLGLNAALEGTAEQGLLLSRSNMLLTGQAAVAGFGSAAIFTPNEGAKKNFGSFVSERVKNGVIGGVDMAAITAGTLGLKSLGTAVAKDSPLLSATLRNGAVGAAISGYPTGALSAQMHARLFEGRNATGEEMEQSAFGMSVVGFGLGALHGKATEHAVDRATNPTISDVLKTNIEHGYNKFDNFMASINPLLASEPRLAYATVEAGGLRSRAMQSTMADLSVMMRDGEDTGTASSGRRNGRGSSGSKGGSDRGSERTGSDAQSKEVLGAGEGKGTPLSESLRDLHLDEIADFVERHKVLSKQRVVRSLGEGNDSPAVLELAPSKAFPDGGALKVTLAEGGWMNEWGKRSFDAELLTKPYEMDSLGADFEGSARVYVQELVDTAPRYEQHQVDELFRKITKSGLEFGDQGADIMKQVGISRRTGKLVLIDYPAVDKAGTHETLRQITEGAAHTEEQYEAENAAIKAGKNDVEPIDQDHQVLNAETEAAKQDALKGGKFSEREQDYLNQIKDGIPRSEVLEFYAMLEGITKPNGMPDTVKAKNAFDALVRRAQEAGILEKGGKKAKMADDDF